MPQTATHISSPIPIQQNPKRFAAYTIDTNYDIELETTEKVNHMRYGRFLKENSYCEPLSANSASLQESNDNTFFTTDILLPEYTTFVQKLIQVAKDQDNRSQIIWKEFNEELFKKNVQNFELDQLLRSKAISIINKLSKIKFTDCTFEMVKEDSFNFNLFLSESLILMVSYPLSEEYDIPDFVVFSLFENKKLIISNAKPLDEVVKGANALVQAI